ncbi:MAG: FtsX-like permease family protein [Clostridia bacterium]|nr:FtsX-like permease family protein [Clostridia bacterium]
MIKVKSGAWLDEFYAKENNLKVGDSIKFKYDTLELEEEIAGIINVPDHLYDVKDASELLPNRQKYGFVYVSSNEIPEKYIKEMVMKKAGITDENIFELAFPNFEYEKYIPYNYLMVDVKENVDVNKVKDEIEPLDSCLAIIDIEDTPSYSMYQGEIDEGKGYVGIFSGLFIFIAMLSVVTTMTRVIKRQRVQIGVLKALGFSNFKISLHYIGYGFFVSFVASICGMLLGRYFLGEVFINMEMKYFEVPNGKAILNLGCYAVAVLTVVLTSLITYFTCRKELKRSPAETLRLELPKVKKGSLNITTKGIFKKMSFASKWNFRDVVRNKIRTFTAIVGTAGSCMLVVCALGMLDSMNYFIKLQFEELYNFDYKLSLKEDITNEEIAELENIYGTNTSKTLGIEIKDENGERKSNNAFVYDAGNMVRFQNDKAQFIDISNDSGIYVTYKFAELNGYKLGDKVKWHIYGDNKYYETEIVGFNKDPQNQNMTMTKAFYNSLGLEYIPDTIYTSYDLSGSESIQNVETVQDITTLKNSITEMLSMMKTMIVIIIVVAALLGVIIIYNMGVLSYSEKQYQFSTLKVLGFSDKKIKRIFTMQNNWITILSIILGLPVGNFLTDWLFKVCIDDEYDFGVHINLITFVISAVGTFVISYLTSKLLARKIKNIDMVSSLKSNE